MPNTSARSPKSRISKKNRSPRADQGRIHVETLEELEELRQKELHALTELYEKLAQLTLDA